MTLIIGAGDTIWGYISRLLENFGLVTVVLFLLQKKEIKIQVTCSSEKMIEKGNMSQYEVQSVDPGGAWYYDPLY